MNKRENDIIKTALSILENNLTYCEGVDLSSPGNVKDYLRLKLRGYENEVFSALFLDSQHKLIRYEELFTGSIASATVYPREVIKQALKYNASSIMFAHNHPSGCSDASQADQSITQKLKKALSFVDIQVLDHIIVGNTCTSFAEQGLL